MQNAKTLIMALLVAAAFTSVPAETNMEKKEEAVKKAPYLLTTCIVSDEALGSMGEAYVFEYKGQEVLFCCSGCKKDFLKEPEKYMAKLKAAQTKMKKDAAAKKMHGGEHGEMHDKSKDDTGHHKMESGHGSMHNH